MTSNPVCPAHAGAAKACSDRIDRHRKMLGWAVAYAEEAAGCARDILADCLASGCAARWAKGLELARAIRADELGRLSHASPDSDGDCEACCVEWPCAAIRLADHLEGR